jgi:hypothetical protein
MISNMNNYQQLGMRPRSFILLVYLLVHMLVEGVTGLHSDALLEVLLRVLPNHTSLILFIDSDQMLNKLDTLKTTNRVDIPRSTVVYE